MASTNLSAPMSLLNLTLQRPGYIHAAASGNFSSPKAQEIVVVKGTSYIELLRTDAERLKVTPVCTFNCFCNVRCLLTFRQVRLESSASFDAVEGRNACRSTHVPGQPSE